MSSKVRDKVKTRHAILVAAEELFAAKGFSETSMRHLAESAGVKAATLYHYFPSKNALLVDLFEDFYKELAKLYSQVENTLPKGSSLRSALVAFMTAHRSFIEERPNFSSIFLFEGVREGSPVQNQMKEITASSAAVLKRLSNRWPELQSTQVVALFLSVVGLNIFFQKTDGYLEVLTGESLSRKDQTATITALIGNDNLEEKLTPNN